MITRDNASSKKRVLSFTQLHQRYLRALKYENDRNKGNFVSADEWLTWCRVLGVKTHKGEFPKTISGSMIEEVPEPRGYIEIKAGLY